VLPFTMTVIVPSVLLRSQQRVVYSDSLVRSAPGLAGGVVIAAGLALFAWCVTLFARVGRGTLAPWDPTRALVGVGPYRYVRNPMITGVALVLVGEALVFRSISLAAWAAIFLTVNHMYFVFVEEPGLAARFGEPYWRYQAAVPRWLPRLRGRR
jgi:protein-S-isoprenylcysteine O-methyltransferase Ste14